MLEGLQAGILLLIGLLEALKLELGEDFTGYPLNVCTMMVLSHNN